MGVSAAPDLSPNLTLDRTLAALADPHRRQVINLLRERPRPAGELARAVGLAPPAMSRHLRTLRQSGLVEESHPAFDARVRVYALRPEPMIELLRWLEETERLWSAQLLALRDHLLKDRPSSPATPDAGDREA
ncbi:ArsR/SmtB family transcription factor [Caulobacter sp. KR2-114]|uniref:ArsR/SmtB family transcription factor n=1 Tax=Caulobacter sp. KR2-114 TaxID=3400912 RepID=UPI003C04944F